MKAVRFHEVGSPEILVLEHVPDPTAGAGELLVRVITAGINFADTVRRRGAHYPVPTPLPFIPGGEVIGTVEAIGDGVDGFMIGDLVFANPGAGGCAELVSVPAAKAYIAPANIDPVKGIALMIQGLTAALTLREAARMRKGDVVFIQGAAGGVGLLAVQIAKSDGARLVIGGASSSERRRLAEQQGADMTVNYNAAGWTEEIMAATGGCGVDVVLEMSGGDIFSKSLECLAPFGRMVIYGNASGQAVPTRPQSLIGKNQSLTGFYLGGVMQKRALITATLADLAQQQMNGQLDVHVGGTFALDKVADAHRMLEAREATGKLVMHIA